MSAFSISVEDIGSGFQVIISRDLGREIVVVPKADAPTFLRDFANDPSQETLRRWYINVSRSMAREVVKYDGAIIEDAGERIRVRFPVEPKPGVIPALREFGFRVNDVRDAYEKVSNPTTIFGAQEILSTHGYARVA